MLLRESNSRAASALQATKDRGEQRQRCSSFQRRLAVSVFRIGPAAAAKRCGPHMKSSSNHPGSNVKSNISTSRVELPRWLAGLLAASLAVSHAGAQVTTPAPAGSTQVPAAQPSTPGQVPAAQPGKSAQAPGPQPAKPAQSTAATTA